MSQNSALLIWPPILTSNTLPLSIPFLNAYLRRKGRDPVRVYDMNMALLKLVQPHWSLYALLLQATKNMRRKGRTDSGIYRFIDKRLFELMEKMEVETKRGLPWSLHAILEACRSDAYLEQKQKVAVLLQGVEAGGGPQLVGLSVIYPEQLFFAVLIAAELKRRVPGVRIVAGGAQISRHIDYLKGDKDVAALFDYLVVEDGQQPFLELLDLPAGGDAMHIPNLYVRSGEGGFVYTGKEFLLPPDEYPMADFSGFDRNDYSEFLPVMASKGCPWSRCAFCSFCLKDHRYHLSSVDRMADVLGAMEEHYGTKGFYFMDDALPTSFMKGLAQVLLERKKVFTWTTAVILSRDFLDPDLCALLKSSGLRQISFGMESASPRLLRLMEKYHQGLDPEEIARILTVIREAGIHTAVSVFFGFPTESKEEAQVTLEFILRHIRTFDVIKVQNFCLEDGTRVAQEPERFGITRIYFEDKNAGRRLGFRFEVREGMSQSEAADFTRRAIPVVIKAHKKR